MDIDRMIFSLEKVYWSLTSSLGKMQESYVSPVYQYKCRFLKSEKSAIIPTKNEVSNRIQFSVKQNLRTYRMRVKLCYGFNVKDLRDRNYFFGFFHFSAIYLFGKFHFHLSWPPKYGSSVRHFVRFMEVEIGKSACIWK